MPLQRPSKRTAGRGIGAPGTGRRARPCAWSRCSGCSEASWSPWRLPLACGASFEWKDLAACLVVVSERAPLNGELPLPLHLALVRVGKAVVGEGEEEGHELAYLRLAEVQRLDPAVEVRVRLPAPVVVVYYVPEGGHRAVVHVRRRDADVAHLRGLERADVRRVARDDEAAKLRHVRLQGEPVELFLRGILGEDFHRSLRELLEVLVARRDADVVKAAVRPHGARCAQLVARGAARLAVEQRPSGPRLIADRARVPASEAVERRVDEHQRALERGERATDVLVVDGPSVRGLERLPVLGVAGDGRGGGVAVGLSHLDGVDDRQLGLILERRGTAVPELAREEHRVEGGGRVALANLIADALGRAAAVRESAARVVARGARHGAIARESRIEVELPPEGDACLAGLI